jgi:hypothetical protein
MMQWEITLEYYPATSRSKSHFYWQVTRPGDSEAWGPMIIGAGRAETLIEAMDDAGSTVDVDLNNDWV